MATWILRCKNCENEFEHSRTVDYEFPRLPVEAQPEELGPNTCPTVQLLQSMKDRT